MQPIPPQLSTNVVLELLTLAYLTVNVIAYLTPGIMRMHALRIFESSERTFDTNQSGHPFVVALLMIQFFLFVGLHLFLAIAEQPADLLAHPDAGVWLLLLQCVAVPLVWYVLQQGLYLWWSMVFGLPGRLSVMNRVYQSVHIVVSPIAMVAFLFEMVGIIEPETAIFLLSLTFILMQILLIYSGIKIFWGGWSTLCFIFLYLCALEIAPLVMLFQLLTR